jgi:hypothetical protein
MVATVMELAKVHLRLDQPGAALSLYGDAAPRQPWEPGLLLGAARVHDAMGQGEEALRLYQQVGGRQSLMLLKKSVSSILPSESNVTPGDPNPGTSGVEDRA